MKLEKREITLNERDSLLDMYFREQALQTEYEKGAKMSERKETELALRQLSQEAEKDRERLHTLLLKVEKNKGSLLWRSEEEK